jgi:hypothetical protein
MFELFKMVATFVTDAEAAMPAGKGADKLALVENAFKAWAPVVGVVAPVADAAWPFVKAFVGRIVDRFNETGIFKRSAPTPPAA